MKITNLFYLTILVLLGYTSCDIDQTQEGKLPEIDVDIETEAGRLPAFDVDWADVNVGTRTTTIKVPKVRVVMEEEEVEIPYIDVDMPDADVDKEEITLIAEAEVTNEMQNLDIVEVLATGDDLYVLSELTPTGKDLGDERARVSDRLVLNAPDLDIKYYIVGKRPEGVFNTQYKYIANRNVLDNQLKNAKSIYKK